MHKFTLFPERMDLNKWLTFVVVLFSITSIFGRPVPKDSSFSDNYSDNISYLSYANVSVFKENNPAPSDFAVDALTNTGWFYECGDDKRVDEYGFNAKGNTTTTTGTLPDASSIFKYAVEIVYKGSNPGSTITIKDSSNNSHTLTRSVPFGSSSNIWVYRNIINSNTSSVTYTNSSATSSLQSMVVYAFRNVAGASGSSGVFTNRSGYNDIQTITIDIPSHPVPRDLIIETPISEMTPDGRYLKLKASAEVNPGVFITDQVFVYGPDTSLPQGTCCLTIPVLVLNNVPGDITQITITVDTRNGQNGQTVNGQSWVIAAGVNVDAMCANNPDIALIKTGVFDDNNGDGVAQAGETVTYSFNVTNTGQTDLNDITINDPLVSVNGSLAFLGAGQSNNTAFTATYTITQNDVLAGFVENQALVSGCYEYMPVDPAGNCSGQVTSLVLEYQGDVIDGTIKVIEHDGQIVYQGVVQPGERFEFFGQDPPQNTLGSKVDIYMNNVFVQEIHTSCSIPIGPGSVFGEFEVISGTSRNNGPLMPVAGDGCVADATDLSDDNSNIQDDPTIVPLPGPMPTPRDCNCSLLYKTSSFTNPQLVSGTALHEGAVYRFANVFPNNPHGTTLDALVRIDAFTNGASLLEIDVTTSGLNEAFQPKINSTNSLDQSVLFDITFVSSGGTYGDEVDLSFYATPLDIDGNGSNVREYAEVSLPDAYYINQNTALNVAHTATVVRGTANTPLQAPGGEVSLDPRFTFSSFFESKSSLSYRIGKLDGNDDRYYSLNISCADYDMPETVVLTYPVICGNVSDEDGNPLANVEIDVTGDDGSSQTVFTNASGDYKAVAEIPASSVDVTYEIRENDPAGYISISDVDGANDNLITRVINVESSCGNDFVDGFEVILELIEKNDIPCNGDNTGSITVQASGGVPPYLYTLNGGIPQTSPVFNNLTAGVYTIEVTDSLGNMDSLSVTLTQPEPISIQFNKIDATATGGCNNGQATATVSGGVGPYTYQWSASAGNQTTATATNLPGSVGGITHTVVVTDENGCTDMQSVVIVCVMDCDATIQIDDITNVLCKGDTTGSATVSASSTANPGATFTFTWNTTPVQVDANVTTSTINNQAAGVYTVSVTIDGTECDPVSQSITITEPSTAINVTATATDETGPTTGDGTATANPTGGTPPYTYVWSPGGETTQTITGLSAGTYTVVVTDANGCEATTSVMVNPGSCHNLSASASSTPVSCNGGTDGTATVGVSGGLGPFTYSWSPGGQTTQTITGLASGVYTVTVTDGSTACTATSTTTVNEPAALSSGIAITHVACYGDATGSLDLTPSGGTPPYTFLWSPGGETTEDITSLTAGTYSVVITDANGCTKTDSATILEPSAALDLTISSQSDIVCRGIGSVTVAATGGTPAYSYSLDGGPSQTSGTFDNLDAGTYTISVVDANGCDDSVSVTILENCTIAVNDFRDTVVNVPITGNVLTNDEDLEGDNQVVTTLTVTSNQGVVVNIAPDGSFTYTPPLNYVGGDFFDYAIEDDGNPQATDTATVFIRINSVGQNNTIANADAVFTEVNVAIPGNVLTNDVDLEGDNQTVTNPGTYTLTGGVLVLNADGTFVYTPNLDFVGTDTFTYSIIDDNVNPATDSAVLTITVVGDPQVNYTFAVDDGYGGNQGATITGNVLDNDFDPEGHDQFVDITISPSSGPANGTVVLNADGNFTYTPNDPAFFGNDSFVYSIFDNGNPVATDQATVSIIISGQNTTIAVNDFRDTVVNVPITGNVLTNDEDLEGDNQVVTTLTVTSNQGVVVNIAPDGSFTYTPPLNYVGGDFFDYAIEDDGNPQATDTATVFIRINPVGQNNTIANADAVFTEVNVAIPGNVLTNDVDLEGDNQTVTNPGTYTLTGGVLVLNADGTFVYTPNLDFVGTDTFTYSIIDDNVNPATDSAVLTITVVGDPQVNYTFAVDDGYGGNQGATITGNVLDNDFDPEGHDQFVDITISPSNGPSNGTVVLNADGSFTYTPNDPAFFGNDSFVYSIFDNGNPVATDQATVSIIISGQNTTIAVNDFRDTVVNVPITGNVLTNDEDLEGDNQVVTTLTVTSNQGVVVNIAPDGSFTYTPPLNYVGGDFFDYAIEDDGNPQATDTATVFIRINPVGQNNTIANADAVFTEVNVAIPGNVLTNDVDLEGDNQTVTNPGTYTLTGGVLVLNADGTFVYTPNLDFVGTDTFTYSIIDDNVNPATDSAVLTITVVGDPQVNYTFAVDDGYGGNQGATITGNVLDNDFDPEGHDQFVDITISPSNGPANGTVVLNADGSFTYTPNDPAFFGNDSFVYSIFDNGNPVATDQATVSIIISGQNLILAVDDINDTFVNLPVDGSVATNDINIDGPAGTETFTLVNGPTNGTLVFNPDGSYTYTPGMDYVGEDTFEYQVCDGGNPIACDTAIVYIEVQPLGSPGNEPPVANADTNSTQVDTPVAGNVLPNDYDPDNDPIVVTANTDPSNGTVVINPDGTYTYTPNPGFIGEDTFTYTICDDGIPIGPALCDTATVTIQVLGSPDNITTAVDDAYYGFPDADITGNVLDNDTDPENNDQFVDTALSPSNGPSNGAVVLNADGSFTYTPNAGFVGTDSFVYEIFDNGAPVARDKATVYISIAAPANEILAVDDINDTFVNLPVNGSVATNDINIDGPAGTETFTLVNGPTNGTLVFNPDGSYTYTPGMDYVGEDTFEYQVCDGGNPIACDTAIVYIEVQPLGSPGNEPPVANADTNSTQVDTPVAGNVLPNDYDPDNDPIVVTANTDPSNGTVVINPDGTYTYTPNPGFIGEDTFTYTICDDGIPIGPALCDTATVTIQVLGSPDNITTAVDDAYYGFPDADITGNVLDNDTDPENNDQFVDTALSPSNGPSNGAVVLNADGSFTYTPNAGFVGTDSFVYEIFDNGAPVARDKATVYISIAAPANEILAVDDINDTFVNLPVDGSVATNDINIDGPAGTETFTLVNGTANGTLVFNPDGSYTYTPGMDYVGEDTFEYQVCDGGNPIACDTAIVYIEVQPLGSPGNEPPVANADTNSTQVDTPVAGNVLPNDYDPDNDPIVVTANTDPSNGTVVINPDGTYTYTPNPGFIGEDTFTYTICDDGIPIGPALCDTATVTIQVLGSPDNITTAVDDAYYGFPDADITGNVLDNDTDPENNDQFVDTALSPSNGPSNGAVVLNADGSFTYTPNPGFVGTDSFVYEIFDNGAPVARDKATVYISIAAPANEILAVDDINDTFVNLPVNGSVATNDENYDGPMGTEVFTLVSGPTAGGVLVFNADGTYTYTPPMDFVGIDTFEYQVCDGGNPIACDTATVTISVVQDPVIGNDPPVANNDVNITEVNVPVDGNILVNDFDPDLGDTISVTTNTNPSNGTVTVAPNGDYTYTPNPGFLGVDTFQYTICDSATPSLCDTATVTIYVIGDPGNITVANDDAYYGEIDTPITGNLLDNDSDPELDTQELNVVTTPVSGPTNGTVTVNPDGSFVYTPGPGFTGNDQFVYEIFDNGTPVATDQATVYILIAQTPAPAIAIVKSGVFNDVDGDNCADAGTETITYTFTVTNEGNVPLNTITVTDPLLEAPNPVVAITFVGGDTNGNNLLDVTETWTYTADYTITQDDIDLGSITNQATAQGTDADGTTVSDLSDESLTTEDDPTVTVLCQSPVIAIVKTGVFVDGDGNQCADAGEAIDYTFVVTNEGNVSLSNITVTDPLLEAPNPVVPIVFAGGDTDGDLELDVTETWTYTASYAITQDDIDAGQVTNQATTTGTAPDATVVSDLSDESLTTEDDPTVTVLCQSPVIAIVKTGVFVDGDGNQCADAGEAIDYTFVVTNEGNVSLSNITVTDPLLEAPNPVVPIVFAGGDTDGDLELDVTETWTYTASYAITQDDIDAGQVTNQATTTGTAPDATVVSDLSDESLTTEDDPTVTVLCQSPVIAIVKTGVFVDGDGNQCADAGEAIDYTFVVTNEGNVSLSNITVTDPLLEAPNPVVPIVFAGGDTDGDLELDVTETWTYTASYAITQDDIDAGQVTNQATTTGTAPDATVVSDLSDESLTTEDDPTVTVLCQSPVIAIVKTGVFVDGDGNQCADAGEAIDYTFVVTNEGNVSLSNITVTDPLLEAPNPVVPIVFAGGDTDGDLELDVTETWTYTASYAITQDDIDAGQVTNQATTTGTAPDATVVSDLSDESLTTEDDPTVTVLCQSPVIAIVKTGVFVDGDGNQCADAGEAIDYTFVVTNEGNVSLSNITVTDPLLEAPNPVVPIVFAGGDTDGDLELDVTETWTYTASYAITQDDIDAGQVTNQATTTGTAPDATVVSDLSDESLTTEDDPTVTPLCQAGDIAIVKAATLVDGGGCPVVGDVVTYTFTVTNEGNVTLDNIVVTDPLLEAPNPVVPIVYVSGDIDGDLELDLDESWEYTADYVLTQADVDAGQVVNQATAEGALPSGALVIDLSHPVDVTLDEPTVIDICQSPFIALIKTGVFNDLDGDGCADPKETITYSFEVFNLGNVTLFNVDIEDNLVNVLGGPITLAPLTSDSTTFTATYLITQADINAGFVENQAIATGTSQAGDIVMDDSDDDSEFENDPTITPLCQNGAIALIKTAEASDQNGNGCIEVGESILYEFVVKNTGNVVLSNIIVIDPLVTVIGGPITLNPNDSDSDTFRAEYFVTQADVDAGIVINQAIAEGTTPAGSIVSDSSDNDSFTEDEPTEIGLCQDPRVSLEKEGIFNDDNGDGIPQPGETISYMFIVKNTGDVTLYNLTLEDSYLPGIVISGDPIPVLLPGEIDETTFTATYAISQDDINNGEVINQAVIRGTTLDGTEVSDTSDDPNDLTNIDPDGDGDPDDLTVVILPNVLPAQDFEIFNGITPDGDGLNDFFRVIGIENYPDNNMKIYNRWGVLVYETDGYGGATGEENVFRGYSEGRATIKDSRLLPTGTYFYILVRQDPNSGNTLKDNGYLYINR